MRMMSLTLTAWTESSRRSRPAQVGRKVAVKDAKDVRVAEAIRIAVVVAAADGVLVEAVPEDMVVATPVAGAVGAEEGKFVFLA